MHRLNRLAAAALLATAAAASVAATLEPVRPDQSDSVVDAVFAQGRLWLRMDDGRVASLARGETRMRREELPERASAMCVQKGEVVVVSAASTGVLHVRRHADAWAAHSDITLVNDDLIALACADDSVALVTRRHVVEFDGGKPRTRRLSHDFPGMSGVVMAVHETPQSWFVGTNAGEWGGSLIRIDRQSAALAKLEGLGGPVNAIVDDPGKPGCLVVAEGLIHFISSGRLIQVCDGEASTLYAAKANAEPMASGYVPDVAFFGLAVDGDGLLAVAPGELHRLDAQRQAKVEKMPALHDVDGIGISFDVPGYALVSTRVNQRHSISGRTPMLVPLGR